MEFLERVKQNKIDKKHNAKVQNYFMYIKTVEKYRYNFCKVKMYIADRVLLNIVELGEEVEYLKMLSIRDMAKKLNVNPKTVNRIYIELAEDGWLEKINAHALKLTHYEIIATRQTVTRWKEFYLLATTKLKKERLTI